jgi:hypothetical protein
MADMMAILVCIPSKLYSTSRVPPVVSENLRSLVRELSYTFKNASFTPSALNSE